jgi:hypothetical protein
MLQKNLKISLFTSKLLAALAFASVSTILASCTSTPEVPKTETQQQTQPNTYKNQSEQQPVQTNNKEDDKDKDSDRTKDNDKDDKD